MEEYQLFYLISPEIQDLEAEDVKVGIESLLKEKGGVKLTENLKKIKLAYPVKKQTEAFLGFVLFECLPVKITEIKAILDKEVKIIRYLLINEPLPVKMEEKTFVKPKRLKILEEKPIKKKKEEKKTDFNQIDEELEKVLSE